MKDLSIFGFWGMDNKSSSLNRWIDKEGRIAPEFVVNSDVNADGAIRRRPGKTKTVSLDNAHSLWAGTKMFCAGQGSYLTDSLFCIDGSTATEICEITGPTARVCYEELNGKVYMCNPNWARVYDLETDTIGPWGVSLPLSLIHI